MAGRTTMAHMQLNAVVAGGSAILKIANPHPPPTRSAEHNSLEQGAPLTHGATAILGTKGSIVIELLLIVQILLPADIARMGVVDDDRPVGAGDWTCPSFDARRFTRKQPAASLRPSIHIGAGVGWAVQNLQHPAVGQPLPDQFAIVTLAPQAGWKAQVLLVKVLDDR